MVKGTILWWIARTSSLEVLACFWLRFGQLLNNWGNFQQGRLPHRAIAKRTPAHTSELQPQRRHFANARMFAAGLTKLNLRLPAHSMSDINLLKRFEQLQFYADVLGPPWLKNWLLSLNRSSKATADSGRTLVPIYYASMIQHNSPEGFIQLQNFCHPQTKLTELPIGSCEYLNKVFSAELQAN